jgi:hypothetical protein
MAGLVSLITVKYQITPDRRASQIAARREISYVAWKGLKLLCVFGKSRNFIQSFQKLIRVQQFLKYKIVFLRLSGEIVP